MSNIELLAPVGSYGKLLTALHFGADAVYLGGKNFGLRAFADNFTIEEIKKAVEVTHAQNKKVYVTVNIFANNADFGELNEYAKSLQDIGVDGLIVSDAGIVAYLKKIGIKLDIHLSTQANTLNKYAVEFWRDQGIKRVVLARELNLDAIKEIKDYVGDTVELEAFVHGAMCIAYSGRCLLSTYLTDRNSNRGECVQACRWEYAMREVSRSNELFIQEDERGSYILNSKDMNTLPILDKIIEAGVTSLKIEGRMKSEYYVGCVVNAYRKRIDDYLNGRPYDPTLNEELFKVNHREYTTGFYLGQAEQCYTTSKPDNDYRFCAEVVGYDKEKGLLEVIQRNRFYQGDELEVVSVTGCKTIKADEIFDEKGNPVPDCKYVQQRLFIRTDCELSKRDMLRKRTN
ncbi:MAG: U32 family peptidase [Clostridia bacterium]|nr:U32 family peptidase [Clostridia bacterium]